MKAPLSLAHIRQSVNPKKVQIAITEDDLAPKVIQSNTNTDTDE